MAYSPSTRSLRLEFVLALIATLFFFAVSDDGGPNDPVQIVAKAFLCFDDRVVYARCDDAYRLTASGVLNIPEAATDAYCSGPCLEETDLVLHCIDQIMNNFEFYNRATIRDIRGTIHDGCGQTGRRGHFEVSEHIQADQEDTGSKVHQAKGFLLAMLCVAASLFAA